MNRKIVAVTFFILLLFIMRHYEMIFLSHGITHSLDMRFGYSSNNVYSMFHLFDYKEKWILIQYFFVDYIFIVYFAAIQIFILRWVMSSKLENTKTWLITVIPFLRGALDAVENTLFIFLIIQLPREITSVVPVMSFITQMKFIAYGAWFFAVAFAFVFRLINKQFIK